LDDEEFLPKALENLLRRFLQLKPPLLGAKRHARTVARTGYQSGYKPRTLKTRVGRIGLSVPQDRDRQFHTELFGRYERNEKSLVSQLCQDLDADIEAWRNRRLTKPYPYLIIDGRYEYMRDSGKAAFKAVLITKDVSESVHRQILAVDVANTESEVTRAELFGKLKERGVQGVLLVTSDEHKGLVGALRRHLERVPLQRCETHFQRNVRDLVPRSQQGATSHLLREVFNASNPRVRGDQNTPGGTP